MKRSKEMKEGLSRRTFLKTTAAGVSATALTAFGATPANAAGLPTKWEKEADVVVVGCGGAGITAAITAHDAGAKVIVIEKAPEVGGNSKVCGAQFCYSVAGKQKDAAAYMHTVCNGTTPMDVCQAWANEIVNNREWLSKMGVKYEASNTKLGGGDYRGIEGANCIGTGYIEGHGIGLLTPLEKQLKDRGIELLLNSPVKQLIQDPITKEILGVKVAHEGAEKSIKARRAVILTTGGFEYNEDMKKNYLRPSTIKFVGWKYNTGDGIKLAQSVGADLWHMNMIASAAYTIVTPNSEMGWMYPEPKGSNFIFVTKYGQRFVKEGAWFPHRSMMGFSQWDWRDDRKDTEYPCCPHYMIFDEKVRLAGPIGINEKSMFTGMGNTITPTSVGGTAPGWGEVGGGWSPDNSVEIEKGWIKKADSIEALAELIGGEMTAQSSTLIGSAPPMPGPGGPEGDAAQGGPPTGAPAQGAPPAGEPAQGAPMAGGTAQAKSDALTATVKRWNEFCEAGVDADFGRSNSERGMFPRKLEKIQTPPFYAIELWPGGFCTLGGPKKNAQGQVLGVDEKPIKRLYAAGSLGHTLGQVYCISGANYGEALAWGRISGRNAAAEKPLA